MAPYGIPRHPANFNGRNDITLNWRRGLFRVWLLLSVAWILGWLVYLLLYGIQGGFKELSDFFALPVLLFGPPVALLLFGAMAGWAFKGFIPDKNR